MRVEMFVAMVGAVMLVSGCAGQRSAQTIKRLQSDVQLLDERVSQLERASLRAPSAMLPMDAPPSEPMRAPVAEPVLSPAPTTPPAVKPSKKEIQRALKNAGFYQGSIDGKIGQQTHEAIMEFQRVHGLQADGLVGKQTWKALAPYLDPTADSEELNAAETLK